MTHLISFWRGERFAKVGTCPNCQGNLMIDKMSSEGTTLFVCFKCNYKEEREEDINETISDYYGST